MALPELHLFIIWNKAKTIQDLALKEISANFEIISLFQINWSEHNYRNNLRRFYKTNLPSVKDKIKSCGTGPFLLLIVRDHSPNYQERVTYNQGAIKVNSKTFDCKTMLRAKLGPKSSAVHASNNPDETRHDLSMLLGLEAEKYLKAKADFVSSSEVISLKQDLIGTDSWRSLSELFYVLNNSLEYIVLRNFDHLPDSKQVVTSDSHLDIDILTCDRVSFSLTANAKPVHLASNRVQNIIKIANQEILFDIRHQGDGYYDQNWQKELLRTRVLHQDNFYTPDAENHFYSLLYHAYLHKKRVAPDYKEKLNLLAQTIGIAQLDFDSLDASNCLNNFLSRKNYKITKPKDGSVYFNKRFLNNKHLSPTLIDKFKVFMRSQFLSS